MRSLLILLLVAAVIVIPLLVLHRRYRAQREAAEMREANVLQDAVFHGGKAMRENDVSRCPVMSRAGSKPELRPVDRPTATMDDSAWMFGAADKQPDDHAEVRTPGIFKGSGGSFDGAGASGDWDTKRAAAPVTGPARSDEYSTPASYSRSSYDSSPSRSDDSGSTSSSDSSSSSDGGSSSSSD